MTVAVVDQVNHSHSFDHPTYQLKRTDITKRMGHYSCVVAFVLFRVNNKGNLTTYPIFATNSNDLESFDVDAERQKLESLYNLKEFNVEAEKRKLKSY